ncbi:MAG: hypothetical protein U1C74_09810 [Phenylobacterium sp.]|nr:hypothetical protein [Phenylobacterium sp.]
MEFLFAELVHRRALEIESPAELDLLARASARMTRSMRQNLALLSRQKAERAKAAREALRDAQSSPENSDKSPPPSPAEVRRAHHMDDIQTGVGRIIAAETGLDRPRLRSLLYRFDREMEDWEEQPDFEDFEPDVIIRHACGVLGLPVDLADRWRTLPDPGWLPDPEPARDAAERDPDRVISWPPLDDIDVDDDEHAPAAAADSS